MASPNKVHVEHIYPLEPSFPKWDNHESVVNRLGNQTLLSARLNQSIKNSPFDQKKSTYATSDLLITKELAALDAWNIDAADVRQKAMAVEAVSVWPLPVPAA